MPAVSLLTFDENNPKALGIGPTGIRCDLWMDWFCWENLNRKPWIFIGFSHWTWGFPVNFPLKPIHWIWALVQSVAWSMAFSCTWKTVQASTDHPSTEIPCVGHDVWSVSPHVLSSNVWIRTLANCFARFLVGSHRALQTRSGRDFITSILTSMQVAWQSTCGSG